MRKHFLVVALVVTIPLVAIAATNGDQPSAVASYPDEGMNVVSPNVSPKPKLPVKQADRAKGDHLAVASIAATIDPAPEPVRSSAQPAPEQPAAPASSSSSASRGGGCSGMEAESGSAGYSAKSPSGYIGCYQISPDHYSSGGSCAGLGTDPSGQDACAQRICATEGAGAWTNGAGQNPCGKP